MEGDRQNRVHKAGREGVREKMEWGESCNLLLTEHLRFISVESFIHAK